MKTKREYTYYISFKGRPYPRSINASNAREAKSRMREVLGVSQLRGVMAVWTNG